MRKKIVNVVMFLAVLAAALGMGVSQATAALASFPTWVTTIFGKSPVVLATIIAVLLNVILPRTRDEKK